MWSFQRRMITLQVVTLDWHVFIRSWASVSLGMDLKLQLAIYFFCIFKHFKNPSVISISLYPGGYTWDWVLNSKPGETRDKITWAEVVIICFSSAQAEYICSHHWYFTCKSNQWIKPYVIGDVSHLYIGHNLLKHFECNGHCDLRLIDNRHKLFFETDLEITFAILKIVHQSI